MKKTPMWRRYDRMNGADPRADAYAELQFHLESKAEDLIAQGWRPEAARGEARRQFGNLKAIQYTGKTMGEKMDRRRRIRESIADLLHDLRYTLRTLRTSPGFTSVAILVLALGVGLNSAVFTIVNAMLLRPLPFPKADQLVWFTGGKSFDAKTRAAGGLSAATYTVDVYREFQRNNQSFQSVTAFQTFYNSVQYKMTGTGQPLQLDAVEVAGNFFPALGVTPVLGRNFTEDETLKGSRHTAILSYYFWKTQFAADPNIVGKTVDFTTSPAAMNGTVTIIGVLPESFDFSSVFAPGKKVDLFVPAVMDFWSTWGNTLAVVGRLKPGITPLQAQSEADLLFPHMKLAHQDWFYDYASDLAPLKEHVAGSLHRSLVVLWSAVGLILLIVCVNLSNLQLSRAATRSKEFAMRRALGASRMRIVRQLMMESLVLSAAGSVVGLAIAFGIIFYLAHQTAISLPLLATIHLDTAGLLWTMASAVVIGVCFGFAPALRMSGASIQESIKENGADMAAGRSHERFRSLLVISEIGLACLLLIGAGLLLRSFLRVLDIDLGFNPSHAAAMPTDLPPAGGKDKLIQRAQILRSELDRVRALPGVESAGIADMLPLDRNRQWGLESVGRYHAKGADGGVLVYLVTPGYLQSMGMRLVGGRDFTWNDTPDAPPVIIINQAAARREWPGEDAVDKLAYGTGKTPDRVIGVIADVHESSLEQNSSPEMYVPMTQVDDAEGATLIVRSRVDPASLSGSVLTALRSINPSQPATEFRPLQSLVDRSVSPRRFFALLVTIFASLGILLAALGIYGVVSYSVTQKTQEIGVRMALGASRAHVLRAVLQQTLRLALIGLAAGIAVSFGAARLVASLLYATSPWDPVAYLSVGVFLIAIALLSGYLPARRASKIQPIAALRSN